MSNNNQPPPYAIGVSRDADSPGGKFVLVAFNRALTDDELRAFHDQLCQREAIAAPAQELSALPEQVDIKWLRKAAQDAGFVLNPIGELVVPYPHSDATTYLRKMVAAICRQQGGSDAARDVLAERQRQINVEGWTSKHDDQYQSDELPLAAACYAITSGPGGASPNMWPWPEDWWKPSDERRNMVKAGALILAEIERLDRAAIQAQAGDAPTAAIAQQVSGDAGKGGAA